MPEHDPRVFLLHMLEHARKALSLASGLTREDLDTDEVLRYALTHLVAVIGEAASQVPLETRAANPAVPWTKIVALRHRLIHGYASVDYAILWEVITQHLPPLIVELETMLRTQTSVGLTEPLA